MTEFYSFTSQEQAIHILHLTDPHLFGSPDEALLGVNTHASFRAVVAEIQQQAVNFDLILATGDLVQDHHPQGYLHFAEQIRPLVKPVFWLEGNHDSQPAMRQGLASSVQIQPMKQILVGDHWQILLLDSHVDGSPHGELSQAQLEWLAQKLRQYPDRFVLIALHHNILPTHSAWLDQHSLRNPESFAEILRPFNIKGILHGHIHQQVDSHWQSYPIMATPSTCIQFKPNCDQFTLDLQPAGWRELTLYPDGRLETSVKRLDRNDFLPDLTALGY